MICVIMAGGKGTRISSVESDVPKPMIKILGKPILEYQIEFLSNQGYKDIVLVTGHLGYKIKEYFGDGKKVSPVTHKAFDVNIEYIEEKEPLGTAGTLYLLKKMLTTDFLLLNGDIIFDININKFVDFHLEKNALATVFTHPNDHPYDSAIIASDANDVITDWFHKEEKTQWYRNRVNAGIHILSPKLLLDLSELKKLDLDRDILKPNIFTKKLFAYNSPEYVKDMGTPDRYKSVTEDLKSGRVHLKNLLCPQKAIFLDRDGTINKYVGFLTDINKFELLEGTAEAIKLINQKGFLAIVITNQPVIARGDISIEELHEIHKKLETLLGNQGAYIDDLFFCPHHPHSGFSGERKEYKIECTCRKPKAGMLHKAALKYNVDLHKSWMIGDGDNDLQAGLAAGCNVALISTDQFEKVPVYPDLISCIKNII